MTRDGNVIAIAICRYRDRGPLEQARRGEGDGEILLSDCTLQISKSRSGQVHAGSGGGAKLATPFPRWCIFIGSIGPIFNLVVLWLGTTRPSPLTLALGPFPIRQANPGFGFRPRPALRRPDTRPFFLVRSAAVRLPVFSSVFHRVVFSFDALGTIFKIAVASVKRCAFRRYPVCACASRETCLPAVFSSVLVFMLCVYPLTVLSRWIKFLQVHAKNPDDEARCSLDHV